MIRPLPGARGVARRAGKAASAAPALRALPTAALAVLGIPGLAVAEVCTLLPFSEVSGEAGIAFHHQRGDSGGRHLPETMGSGVAWLDFDGDGWWDLYAVQSGAFPPAGDAEAANRLYRNRGGGRFEDWTERTAAGDRGYGQGAVAADADGDGATDLYVANFGADALLVNRGDGSFEERAAASGLRVEGWSSSAALADADGDGDLDLYVTRYLEYDPSEDLFCGDLENGRRTYCDPSLFAGAADLYFRNRGDGTFEEATAEAGFTGARGRGLGVVATDLDGDHRPDLYVANDLTLNLLFRNRGDGTFEDLSLLSGTAVNREGVPEAGMGVAVGDIDGDGDGDLAVTNFDVETNTCYRNLGQLQFEDISAASGFGPPSFNLLGFGIVLADLDLDGDLDAYVANGHIFERPRRDNVTHAQPDLLLLGDGRGGFAAGTCTAFPGSAEVGRGLAQADFDNDGDPDLALSNSGGPLALLANGVLGRPGAGRPAPEERWLGALLRGRHPNPEAVGAEVELETLDGRRQRRWVTAGDSYQSSSDRRLLFGLPENAAPAALEVRWPSGRRLRLAAPPAGRYLVLPEPE